jgi:hypothetical protein
MYGLEIMKVQQVSIWVWLATDFLLTLDHYENLYCQILGSKTFHLVPPTEYACLKGNPNRKSISFARTELSLRKMGTFKRGSNTFHAKSSRIDNTMVNCRSIKTNCPRKQRHYSGVPAPRCNLATRRGFVPPRLMVSFGITNFKRTRDMYGGQLLVQHGFQLSTLLRVQLSTKYHDDRGWAITRD